MQDVLALFIVAITLLVVILLDRSEHKGINKVLEWIPAILFAYVVPALFTHIFQLDLSSVFLHAFEQAIYHAFGHCCSDECLIISPTQSCRMETDRGISKWICCCSTFTHFAPDDLQ